MSGCEKIWERKEGKLGYGKDTDQAASLPFLDQAWRRSRDPRADTNNKRAVGRESGGPPHQRVSSFTLMESTGREMTTREKSSPTAHLFFLLLHCSCFCLMSSCPTSFFFSFLLLLNLHLFIISLSFLSFTFVAGSTHQRLFLTDR